MTNGLSRRGFVSAASLAGLAAADTRAAAQPAAPPRASWAEVRRQFDVDPRLVHMAGFYLASHPKPVREAIAAHRRGLDADPHGYIEANEARCEQAIRRSASAYMSVDGDSLAMTDSTTMGLGLVYTGLKLERGQEILTDTHDHIVTRVATDYAAERTGATVRRVSLYDDPRTADADAIVQRLAAALRPETRLVALTWVHSGTGVKLPVQRLAGAVANHNRGRAPAARALLAIDGVHGFGLEDAAVGELGCDIFIAGCHKWLFGPRGTGLVWANPGAWALIRPTIPTFDPAWRPVEPEAMPPAAWNTPGGFHSFEHRWALNEAFDFHLALGRARVAERIHALNRTCKAELARLRGVTVHTPMSDDLSGGIICFSVDGLTPDEVARRLHAKRVAASVTPPFYEPTFARVAPGLLNDEADVAATVKAVAAVATA